MLVSLNIVGNKRDMNARNRQKCRPGGWYESKSERGGVDTRVLGGAGVVERASCGGRSLRSMGGVDLLRCVVAVRRSLEPT